MQIFAKIITLTLLMNTKIEEELELENGKLLIISYIRKRLLVRCISVFKWTKLCIILFVSVSISHKF